MIRDGIMKISAVQQTATSFSQPLVSAIRRAGDAIFGQDCIQVSRLREFRSALDRNGGRYGNPERAKLVRSSGDVVYLARVLEEGGPRGMNAAIWLAECAGSGISLASALNALEFALSDPNECTAIEASKAIARAAGMDGRVADKAEAIVRGLFNRNEEVRDNCMQALISISEMQGGRRRVSEAIGRVVESDCFLALALKNGEHGYAGMKMLSQLERRGMRA